jgi:hypothetical protein
MQNTGATVDDLILGGSERRNWNLNRGAGGPKESTSFQRGVAGTWPKHEIVTRYHQYGSARRIDKPAEDRSDEWYAIAIRAVGNDIKIDLGAGGNLATKVVEPHQKIGGKPIGLVLDLSIGGIPADDVLRAAANAIRVVGTVQKVMPELVGEREIDPAARGESIVIDDASPCLVRWRTV